MMIVGMGCALGIASGPSLAACPDNVIEVVRVVTSAVPQQWRTEVIRNAEPPYWTENAGQKLAHVRLIGPEKSGYRYHLASGDSKDVLFKNEVIDLWIAARDFDDGWSFGRRLVNRFSKTPTELPSLVAVIPAFKIYAKPGWRNLGGKDPQPIGTVGARTLQRTGSWPGWDDDLENALSRRCASNQ